MTSQRKLYMVGMRSTMRKQAKRIPDNIVKTTQIFQFSAATNSRLARYARIPMLFFIRSSFVSFRTKCIALQNCFYIIRRSLVGKTCGTWRWRCKPIVRLEVRHVHLNFGRTIAIKTSGLGWHAENTTNFKSQISSHRGDLNNRHLHNVSSFRSQQGKSTACLKTCGTGRGNF